MILQIFRVRHGWVCGVSGEVMCPDPFGEARIVGIFRLIEGGKQRRKARVIFTDRDIEAAGTVGGQVVGDAFPGANRHLQCSAIFWWFLNSFERFLEANGLGTLGKTRKNPTAI